MYCHLYKLCFLIQAQKIVSRAPYSLSAVSTHLQFFFFISMTLCIFSGETPHRCDFCSKTFTRKEHLLNHVRQHTGESPHRCNFCSKSFTRREHLVNHVRQHTGETPFQCGYCPKAFTRKDHLGNTFLLLKSRIHFLHYDERIA